MRILSITRKTLLEAWREPKLAGLLLLFPAALIVMYYIAFGQTSQGLSQFLRVMILNQDGGAAGALLTRTLEQTRFEGSSILAVSAVGSRDEAEVALRERKAAMLIIIPPNFTAVLDEGRSGRALAPAALELVGDATSDNYIFASSFVTSIATDFAKQSIGWQGPETASIEFVPGTGTMSDLQFGIPGVLVFGITFGTIVAATVLVREERSGTLQRLCLTRARAGEILAGISLAQMLECGLQIPLAFGVAVALGFKSPGSLALAIGIGMLLSFAATGLGLMAACFARNDGEAVNLGTLLLLPLAFLSGTVFPMPPAPVATIAGRVIQAYDILPTAHAAEAMRRVLVYGDGPTALVYELVMLTLLAALYFAVGVVLYQWLRLRRLE